VTNTTGFNLAGVFSVLAALCLVASLALGFFLAYLMLNKLRKEKNKDVAHLPLEEEK